MTPCLRGLNDILLIMFFRSIDDINAHCHDHGAKLLTLGLDEYRDYVPADGQRLTVGLHPWDTTDADMYEEFNVLSEAITDPHVVALGEVGIDPLHGAGVARQEQLLRYQLRVASEARMPVVFHIVRRYDILLKLHKELKPVAAWAVHGFRSTPEVVRQLADAGIFMSVGPKFNVESVRAIPRDLLLLETDELPEKEIRNVVISVAEARGVRNSVMAELARTNLRRFLNSGQKSV